MKLRTLEEFNDAIDEETVWRKRELTTARTLVQQAEAAAQRANLRAGVLILYAHWEGWVKATSRLYVRYVNGKRLRYSDLSTAFLGNALKTKFVSLQQASAPTTHNDFALFVQSGMASRASVSEELVQTHSNLSSAVLFDILERLGMPSRPEFTLRANLIDEELVLKRNTIAHGQYLEITKDDFLALQGDVLALLELFTDDLRNAAATQSYLASA